MKNKQFRFVALLMLVVLTVAVIGACAAPAPAEPQVVVQTVVVKETVEVVETEVEVPAEAACETKKDNYKIGFANLTEDIVFTQLVRESIEKAGGEGGQHRTRPG